MADETPAPTHGGVRLTPQVLREYDDIQPGLAGRIVAVAEQQARIDASVHPVGRVESAARDLRRAHRVFVATMYAFVAACAVDMVADGFGTPRLPRPAALAFSALALATSLVCIAATYRFRVREGASRTQSGAGD